MQVERLTYMNRMETKMTEAQALKEAQRQVHGVLAIKKYFRLRYDGRSADRLNPTHHVRVLSTRSGFRPFTLFITDTKVAR